MKKLGIGTFLAAIAVTGIVSAESDLRGDVVAMDAHEGTYKSRITLNIGHDDGIEPGNKAYLPDGKGGKLSEFTIERVGLKASSALTLETTSAVQKVMSANVATRKCHTGGHKAEVKTPDEVAGKTPPEHYLFAKVTIASSESGSQWGEGLPNGGTGNNGFRFEVDKGFDDHVEPGANAYFVTPNTGVLFPIGKIEIRWVSPAHAGGWVTGVPNVESAKNMMRGGKLVIERAHCSS